VGEMRMRILVVNPNTTKSMTESMRQSALMYARPETEIVAIEPAWGPESIEGFLEGFVSAASVLEALATYDGEFDGVVLAGFGAPTRRGAPSTRTAQRSSASAAAACAASTRSSSRSSESR